MKLISIDPGYERLGIAIIEKQKSTKEKVLFSECFKTSTKLSHGERLCLIGKEIEKVITEHKPDALAIESLFFSTNQKTALLVAEARGVILFQAAAHSLPVFEYGPGQIKVAVTGYGKSDKEHIISMIPKLVVITKEIEYDDEYDAIAVGLTCFASERF